MSLVHKLKLLSGQLDGVEFTLHPGDSVFHVGTVRSLHGSQMTTTLASADNVFYIPGDLLPASFRLRCDAEGVHLDVREGDAIAWVVHPLDMNAVMHVAGLTLAIRREDEAWSREVLDHRLPMPSPFGMRPLEPEPPLLPLRALRWAALLVVVGIVVAGGAWLYDHYRPATQARALESVLSQSPHEYAVVHDRQGRIHAFSDNPEALAWAQRASERAGRRNDIFHVRYVEAARIGAYLESAGVTYTVVRLRDPSYPEIVITAVSADDSELRRRVAAMLTPHMPYAKRINVTSVGDAQLVSIARAELRARGITTRVGAPSGRASVVNDVFLDDAALHAMARYRDEFVAHWGERRVRIHIRLWDDLLKGRSYQYSSDQLLSVGEGRWEFAASNR